MRTNLIIWEKENKLKAKDVAKKLKVTEATYSRIKMGLTTPSLNFAYKFIEAFPDVNVIELLKIL